MRRTAVQGMSTAEKNSWTVSGAILVTLIEMAMGGNATLGALLRGKDGYHPHGTNIDNRVSLIIKVPLAP